MSRTLSMLVQNNSSYTLTSYSISHSWDGNNENLTGSNLANNGTKSAPINITSGYTQYDWFTVQLTFDTQGARQTNFYCNSSSDDTQCIVVVNDDSVDLQYYFSNGNYDTVCDGKSFSGDFKAERDQIDPRKVLPRQARAS
jgi:hypothetical protein